MSNYTASPSPYPTVSPSSTPSPGPAPLTPLPTPDQALAYGLGFGLGFVPACIGIGILLFWVWRRRRSGRATYYQPRHPRPPAAVAHLLAHPSLRYVIPQQQTLVLNHNPAFRAANDNPESKVKPPIP